MEREPGEKNGRSRIYGVREYNPLRLALAHEEWDVIATTTTQTGPCKNWGIGPCKNWRSRRTTETQEDNRLWKTTIKTA